ncbi:MAG: helix-turn-helix domain-containing protein [Mucilaginibacter sp.]|uniref:helix-turn-helix domain-containing protein n=1 Tax=Mucilaginibacter sp. TaxID=1882438 RepID=UPI00326591F6
MTDQSALTLVNPQNGNLAFKVFPFTDNSYFDHVQRNNYFTLIWLKAGMGKVKADFSEHSFEANTLFAFSPYQPYMFLPDGEIEGIVINFHSDFFCIHKHHQEVACNGVLFHNIYKPPYLHIDEITAHSFNMLIDQIRTEMQIHGLAQHELLVSYLKIFLITASRLKKQQQPDAEKALANNPEPFILQKLKDNIELHFKTKHSPSNYADLLNITPKALAKLAKNHFNKTLTDLIAERIIMEAKRELYLSNKAVKEIAYELGYDDESYFSRFFKTNTSISPQVFRDTVGFNKAATG